MTLKTIQIVLDDELLARVDQAAAREEVNRSAWVRVALEARLLAEQRADRERRHRDGYARHPVEPGEFDTDPEALVWPQWEEPSQ